MIKKISSFLQTVRRKGRRDSKRTGRPGSLWRDRRGTVAVYVAICAPVLLGIGALVIDLSRVMTVQTDLQSAADAASLAGARELNRFPGARDRAKVVARDAVANIQTFATGGAEITISTADCAGVAEGEACMRFLKSLPSSDDDPITAVHLAASDDEARFIEVNVGTRTVTNILIRIVGGPATSSTRATAVAGNDQVICHVAPMMMCNPSEPPGNTDPQFPVAVEAMRGRQIESFLQATGEFTAGDFGILCPLGMEEEQNCGGNTVKTSMASVDGSCFRADLTTTKTGVTLSSVRTGLNARIDSWSEQARDPVNGEWRRNDKFTPAVNVTQGGQPSGNPLSGQARCEYEDLPADQAMALPRDQCHIDDNCNEPGFFGNPRIGDADWDYAEYFRINHGGNGSAGYRPPLWPGDSLATGPTRFEVYRYEIEKGVPDSVVMPGQKIMDGGGKPVATTAENGHVQCFRGNAPVNTYDFFPGRRRDAALLRDRRVFPIAIANCNALGHPGGQFSWTPPEFLYVFLTERVEQPSEGKLKIYIEALGTLDDATLEAVLRDNVQLYRR